MGGKGGRGREEEEGGRGKREGGKRGREREEEEGGRGKEDMRGGGGGGVGMGGKVVVSNDFICGLSELLIRRLDHKYTTCKINY